MHALCNAHFDGAHRLPCQPAVLYPRSFLITS
jgi:hypothetical protein